MRPGSSTSLALGLLPLPAPLLADGTQCGRRVTPAELTAEAKIIRLVEVTRPRHRWAEREAALPRLTASEIEDAMLLPEEEKSPVSGSKSDRTR